MLLRNFIIACWAVFAAYWAATAASTKRTAQRQSWESRYWYLLLLVLGFALLLGAVPLDPLTRRIVPPSPAVAILLMFLATALAAGRLGGFVGFVLCFASFWIKLRQEEALMMRHFPDEYPVYRARVKALVPFVI